MYQRGKSTRSSRATAVAIAVLLTVGFFSLVPMLNQLKLIIRSGVGGRSVVETTPSARTESKQDSSISIENSRFELSTWESAPAGWSPKPSPVLNLPRAFEMPVLREFEISDEARLQFVFNADDLDFTPSPLFRKRPVYPHQLRQENIEGRVMAEFRVDRDGHTHDVRITESDHPDFAASVVEALLKWQFVPGLVDGEPVEFRMRIPVVFRITASEPTDPDLLIASVD
jgi:TonB family protein